MVSVLDGASWLPPRRDAAIALAVAGLIQVEYHLDYAQAAPITTVKVVLGLLMSLSLAWRRVAPLPSFVVVLATICLEPAIVGTTPNTLGTAICATLSTFSLGVYARSWRESVVGSASG
jgi:hypothetical protein